MKLKQVFLLLVIFTTAMLTLQSCEPSKHKVKDADVVMQEQTKKLLSEANKEIGMPAVTNFTERKLAKLIIEQRDRENLLCYAYLGAEQTGQIGTYLGRCLGYGIPYSVQYTNPLKLGTVPGGEYHARNPYTLPQADPNGLFMPVVSNATWLFLLDEKGEPHPVYIEQPIIVSSIPLKGNEGKQKPIKTK